MTADLHTTTSTADAGTTAPVPTAPAPRRPDPGDASTPGPAHTPGGIPAVPMAVMAANSVVGGVSAAALAAGPMAALAAVLGAGMLTAGTAAARRTTNRRRSTGVGTGNGSTRPSPGRTGARTAHGSGAGTSTGRRSAGSGGRTGTGTVSAGTRSASSTNRPGRTGLADRSGIKAGRVPGARLASSAGGVRELRRQQAAATPTRAQRRQQQTAARREVADARRAARAHRSSVGTGPGTKSQPSRNSSSTALGHSSGSASSSPRARNAAANSGGGKSGRRSPGQVVRSVPATLRAAHRKRQDEIADLRAKRAQKARMAASARRTLLRALVRARLRYLARALPAAALALPLGLLGLLTTPLGRKLGWAWLMYPGRRLYAAMTATARARLTEDLAQAASNDDEREDDEISDRVPRGRNANTTEGTGMDDGQFGFAEAAAEMETAAQKYDPESMMEVMAAIHSIPEGLQSIANIFALLVERSDAEYPMDPAVGEALADVHHLLTQAVTGAEEVCKTFGTAHEADIERLEAPRNGEEKWNYLGD
ncbi:hypothetical protein [Streptomyces sp. JJ38]|uniref:hypothetical protein n=1 Tax=Streptomyces sp. JJ38 TaxID=2738128 RepID=UPI001C56896A|nr:hypothetical protein [Streptomyces sp. JJ38]MBW1599751.1 hypothetical protein [Streptomyces sp. JJ38]